MEALVALSLAANIAQFVDLGFKLVHGAKEVYESSAGMTEESVELDNIIRSMRLISHKIDGSITGQQSDEAKALRRLAGDCIVISKHLDDLLLEVTPNNRKHKHEAVLAALKNVWTRRDRLELERRLDKCRGQLECQFQSVHASDMKKRLESINMSTDQQLDKLRLMYEHIKDLAKGSKVASLSMEAQNQIKSLFELSQSQYETLAQTHILKGLAASNTKLRFEDVMIAHHDTFQWLFVQEDTCNLPDETREDGQDELGGTVHEKAIASNAGRWSVWQLEDGYEEENQDWWYKREGQPGFAAAPEYQHILEAGRRFIEWLSSGDGIFHISGKLGSGKSTLMKYLLDHPKTETVLSTWADGKRLVLANFFFWKPGSKEQKSLNGLFRSLLHEIFQTCPDLVASTFPDQWSALMNCPWHIQQDFRFSDKEIRRAIDHVFDQEHTYDKYAFCLFIDGLDEYEETLRYDYKCLIETFENWVQSSRGGLKICVSSREYNVFQNAFSPKKRIRLQDLTRLDMERYAEAKLKDLENAELKSRLVSEIVDRSDGIFLWVALVVKMLRDYIEDDQDVAAFDSILKSLPAELELLFERLLATLYKPARKRAYQIFALMAHTKKQYDEQLFLLSTIFLDDYDEDPRLAINPDFKYCHEDARQLEITAAKRLNGFCRGLVESKENKLKGSYIAFTHRSVAEFLERDDVQEKMEAQLIGFDVTIVAPHLLLAYLRSTKTAKNHSFWARFATRLITDDFDPDAPFPYLSCLESTIADKIGRAGTSAMETLQPLNQQAIVVWEAKRYYINNGGSVGNFFVVSPLFLSACFGKLKYVKWKVDLDYTLISDEHKRMFLMRCLELNLGKNGAGEGLERIVAQMRNNIDATSPAVVVRDYLGLP